MSIVGTLALLLLALIGLACTNKVVRAYLITFRAAAECLVKGRGLDDEAFRALLDSEVRVWASRILKHYGITLEVTGAPPDYPCLLLCNHQSAHDVPCIFAATPGSISFMPKKEIRKLPFIGRLGDRAGYIWLDRQNPTASKQAMDAAAAALKKRTFLIFPEGTRSGEGISGFKKGAFHVAIKAAGVRVVPVALAGADDLASLDPQRRLVRITFGTPIVVGGSESVDGLLTRVRKEVITLNLALGGRGAKPGTEEEHIALKGNPARKGNAAAVWLKV